MMTSQRAALLWSAFSILAIGWMIAFTGTGCGGTNALGTLQLINQAVSDPSVQTFPRGGIPRPPTTTQTTQPVNPVINTTCDLPTNRKSEFFILRNDSLQNLTYSMTFLISAGSGGFMCEADRPTYTAAGYVSVGNSITLGCDTLTPTSVNGFRGGNELLAVSFGRDSFNQPIIIPPNTSGTSSGAPAAPAPLNGITAIPVPEVIVLGSSDVNFSCQGNDPCTQSGMNYTNTLGVLIDHITVARTQGTICNVNAGSRPEWRLLNPSNADSTAQSFQFVAGGSISVLVLDRVFNTNPNQNKAVWTVVGPPPDFTPIHDPVQ